MARRMNLPTRRSGRTAVPPTVTLAAWRLRQTWRLLLVTGLGMLAAVVLLCTVPLYSAVALTAGLCGVLNASPEAAQITMHSRAKILSHSFASEVDGKLRAFMQQQMGRYLTNAPQFSIQTPLIRIDPANTDGQATTLRRSLDSRQPSSIPTRTRSAQLFTPGDQMRFFGAAMSEATDHLTLVQGRLPAPTTDWHRA